MVGSFTCALDSFELVYWATYHMFYGCGLIVEWRDITTGKENSTGHRWNLNPGPCRYYDQCFKPAKPLFHHNHTYGDCYCYLFLSLTENRFLFLYNIIHFTIDKVFLKQSSMRFAGSDVSIISVHTNEETNPWVQMQL